MKQVVHARNLNSSGAISRNMSRPMYVISARIQSRRYWELLEDVIVVNAVIYASETIIFHQNNT